MEKKLTAQGPRDRKSYTVTLPIEWVKMQGLDKTKSVELDIIGNKVIISQHKEKEQIITINSKDYPTSMIKVLQGLYRAGVNEVRLDLADNSMVEEILDIIEKKLIGYEIIEQKKAYLIIKDITKESEDDFKIIFRRIFLLLLELSESNDIIQIRALDRNIKKLINYCQRILMKKGHVEFTKTPLYYLVLDRLEKLKDEFNWFLQISLPKKKESPKLEYPELKEINILLRQAYELFYRYDAKKYGGYEYRTFQLKNKIKLDAKVEPAVIHLHNMARILNSLYGDIFTLRFDE